MLTIVLYNTIEIFYCLVFAMKNTFKLLHSLKKLMECLNYSLNIINVLSRTDQEEITWVVPFCFTISYEESATDISSL